MVCTTALVAVSMTCTALVVTSMTLRYWPSRENPRPWTPIGPSYIAPSTSALVSIRGLPSGIVPSTVVVFGSITVTVLESWSALYTRSFAEIGCAPGRAGACMSAATGGWPVGPGCGGDPQPGKTAISPTTSAHAVIVAPRLQLER